MTTEGVSVSHLTWCTSSATPMDISVRLILYRSCDKYSTYLITNTAQTLWEILFKLSANTVQILQYRLENTTPGSRGQWTVGHLRWTIILKSTTIPHTLLGMFEMCIIHTFT